MSSERLIPAGIAATAASMTRAALLSALGSRVVIAGPNKLGVRPADLEALSPGASEGLPTYNPSTDSPFGDGAAW